MAQYVGILDGSKDVWGVRIPDVPGCHGGGATPEAAITDAIRALREFAAHRQTKGIPLVPPRSVQEVMRDKETGFVPNAGEAIVMVPLVLDRARPVKANISLDAGFLEAIDGEAERRGLTRSAFFTSAALDKIGKAEFPDAPARAKPLRKSARVERLATRPSDASDEFEGKRKFKGRTRVARRVLSEKADRKRSKSARKQGA